METTLENSRQTVPHDTLPASLREGLDRYIQSRKDRIPAFIEKNLNFQNCLKIQSRHFVKDLLLNPINTLWVIPYLAIRKVFEAGEKLGWEGASMVIPTIPRSFRTDFQKEMERLVRVELFGLSPNHETPSELAHFLEHQVDFHSFYSSHEWLEIRIEAEHDIRKAVKEYCNTQDGFNDLACSGAILVAAQYFFGDRSLDIFAMGRRWAALWSHQEAVKKFPLGHKLGRFFYRVMPAPPPSSKEVYLATGIAIGLLALFSTVVGVFGFPARQTLGFQKPQLEKLLQGIEDKILLRLTKNKLLLHENS